MTIKARNWIFLGLLALAFIIVTACGQPGVKQDTEQMTPGMITLSGPPADVGNPQPGLNIWYYSKKVRHIRQMPDEEEFLDKNRTGPPIPNLDHKFGDKDVFDSGENMGVCMLIKGYINFPAPGDYVFQANSNDGIRVTIDGQKILEDPDVHSDRMSAPATVTVSQPGWRPLTVLYFQRKGTATVQLMWKKPGMADFQPIPPESFAH